MRTLVRSFASVSSLVANHLWGCGEPFTTKVAWILSSAINKLLIVSKFYLLLIQRMLLLLQVVVVLFLLVLLLLQLLLGEAWGQGSFTPSLTTTTTTPWVYLQQRETNIISNLSCHLNLPPDTNLSDIPDIAVIWCCKTFPFLLVANAHTQFINSSGT